MALVTCPECKAEISSAASACPKCGAPRHSLLGKTVSRTWTILKVFTALVIGLVVYQCTSMYNRVGDASNSAVATSNSPGATSNSTSRVPTTGCSRADFAVSELKWRREYDNLNFTGTVSNNAATGCGVQLKVSAYDAQGAVIETQDFWPASVRNIDPGAKENFWQRFLGEVANPGPPSR